jgi:phenylalanyl-tRNA synthetase beta subunit
MTRKLEEILNIDSKEETVTPVVEEASPPATIDLEARLEEFDKISAALPRVKGLGDISDAELDALGAKAEKAYDDLMDLGMNVEARYGARMFEVAANMMNAAIQAKSAKIDKKLKMIDLQIKKLALDKKHGTETEEIAGEGYIMTDRNSILEKLKNLK